MFPAGSFHAACLGLASALQWISRHTGLPVLLIAGMVLAASWRVFRQAARFAVEVTIAMCLLYLATALGLVRW